MECAEVIFSRHALRRMFQRSVTIADVPNVIESGEVVEDYPDDEPWPEVVLLGVVNRVALHVVVGRDPRTGRCVTITVCRPDLDRWDEQFRHLRR
jgi:hypothetical protein